MRCSRSPLVPIVLLIAAAAARAQTPTYQVGRTPTPQEIQAWDIAVGPEGKELPPGSGTASEGAKVYAQKCAVCHGATGAEAGLLEPKAHVYRRALVGGKESLKTIHPIKSVGNWWPFATTLWDFINRAMPADKPGSLSAGEVYALTAVLLYRNGLIKETDRLDAVTLPKIQMPNRNGMIPARVEDIRRWRCPVGTCP